MIRRTSYKVLGTRYEGLGTSQAPAARGKGKACYTVNARALGRGAQAYAKLRTTLRAPRAKLKTSSFVTRLIYCGKLSSFGVKSELAERLTKTRYFDKPTGGTPVFVTRE